MVKRLRPLLFLTLLVITLLACQTITGIPGNSTAGNSPLEGNAVAVNPAQTGADTTTAKLATPDPQVVHPVLPGVSSNDEALVNLYESINPGVVAIQVLTEGGGGLGSGFVYDKEGHIITNFHVIEGFTDLEVDFPSGFKTRGEVIGTDTDSDLAIIKVDAPAAELHPLKMGDSSQLKVGQTVVAIGNPFGFNGTMTVGIISGLGRTLDSLHEAPGGSGNFFAAGDVIQTDTAINPGNSGGPLINLRSEVIGINRAIRTFNFTNDVQAEPLNSGVGFAIPINIVKRVTPALIKDGKFAYPYLGITSLSQISLIEQEALGLPQSTGAYITEVTAGGPAEKAGLRAGSQTTDIAGLFAGGDLITAIDGIKIRQFSELLSYLLNNKSPGDKIVLTIIRGEEEMEVNLTLAERP